MMYLNSMRSIAGETICQRGQHVQTWSRKLDSCLDFAVQSLLEFLDIGTNSSIVDSLHKARALGKGIG